MNSKLMLWLRERISKSRSRGARFGWPPVSPWARRVSVTVSSSLMRVRSSWASTVAPNTNTGSHSNSRNSPVLHIFLTMVLPRSDIASAGPRTGTCAAADWPGRPECGQLPGARFAARLLSFMAWHLRFAVWQVLRLRLSFPLLPALFGFVARISFGPFR